MEGTEYQTIAEGYMGISLRSELIRKMKKEPGFHEMSSPEDPFSKYWFYETNGTLIRFPNNNAIKLFLSGTNQDKTVTLLNKLISDPESKLENPRITKVFQKDRFFIDKRDIKIDYAKLDKNN